MKVNIKDLEKRIVEIEKTVEPKPEMEFRFTMNEAEIDESLENVTWVYLKL